MTILACLGGLHLSAFEPADGAALAAMLADTELRAGLHPAFLRPPAVDWAVANWLAPPPGDEDMQLTIHLDRSRPVGFLRVEDNTLAYFIDRACWGNGYGRSAVAMLMDTAIRRRQGAMLHGFVDRDNKASRRILEGNGFYFSGFLRGHSSSRRLLVYTCRVAGSRGRQGS